MILPILFESLGMEVVMVQADGDELDFNINKFDNLVCNVEKRVIKWFGDTAKTIYYNL